MNNLRTGYLTINIQPEFHQIALQFSQEQDTVAKSKKVYLNTLAILATREFLEESSFATDLDLGDSWNPAVRCFHDVADLVIPDIGTLECLPIVEDTARVAIPKQVRTNRIGYIIVLLSEQGDRAQLLGFLLQNNSSQLTEISLSGLKPIEDLIDYLFDLELANDYLLGDDRVATKVREGLQSHSISEISAQFERIIRTVALKEQQDRAVNILAELIGIKNESELVRRSPNSQIDPEHWKRLELEDLAQSLLNKLKEIWEVFG